MYNRPSNTFYFNANEKKTCLMVETSLILKKSLFINFLKGWGRCFSRLGARGHNHVLQDVTVNGDSCYKCVKIQVDSFQ